ncbi:arylsulfatase [Catalinimonas niigatensis]|uniref:arylsulfatase n=1 Tax=Catalinimonas niigatensis TaxID=1397264 RepID=UPI002665BBB3|nr:arylsulfatase [Catalinimonas niigatensis]WPP51818.1 arylsulfatase [Catalinimonas niigatensis]
MMNRFYIIGLLLAGFFAYTWVGSKSKQTIQKPNIVLILNDDLGYSDLACYGSEIETPNMNRLASEGLRMTQFYNTAKCTETRAAILTGLHHQQTNNLKIANNITLAEVLKNEGYQTILSGKWHLGDWQKETNTPTQRGFNSYFGFLAGAINFFTGRDYATGTNFMRLGTEEYYAPEDFYATDAFTDFALQEVKTALEDEKPFFLYLAYNAPHYPLQVHRKNIDKYLDKYDIGWDSLRQTRYQKMRKMGIIAEDWQLSPRDSLAPAWSSLSAKEQEEEQLLMATYAGMIDRMDEQIGRLLRQMDELDITENTIVMFLSDNGGCPFDANRTPDLPPGPASSSRTYDTEWAQASNTPFRKYKQWIHEGGIATPMIIRWPAKIKANTVSDAPGQIVDIMPTLIELAQATYPESYQGHEVLPMEGISLLPIMKGSTLERNQPMFWEYNGSRAGREGGWKLVAERGGVWELYNLQKDRTEMNNLVSKHPERVADMEEKYNAWAERIGAHRHDEAKNMRINQQDRYLYAEEVKGDRSPRE